MSAPTLADLVTPTTQAGALSLELTIAQQLGLPITSWQPLDPSRTILQINSNIVAQYSQTIAYLAQGGYASYAAQMVDVNSNPVTTWMDLRGVDQYNVSRQPATLATGPVPVANTVATSYPYSPTSPLRFQNPASGATYTSSGSGTVSPAASPPTPVTTDITVQADAAYAGSIGTSAQGVVLTLLTPLAGVSVSALTSSLTGSNAETNAHYLARCQAKLGSLSPNGAPGAYVYTAESIPVFGTALSDGTLFTQPTSTQPFGVTAPISRATTQLVTGTGIVDVIAGNASGPLEGAAGLPVANISWSTGTVTLTFSGAHGIPNTDSAFIILSGVRGATGVNNSAAQNPAWLATATGADTMTFALATSPGGYIGGGVAEVGDLGMVDAAIQAYATPTGIISTTQSVTTVTVLLTATVYVSASSGYTTSEVATNIVDALANYLGSVPIGGYNVESFGVVPKSAIQAVVSGANAGTQSVVMSVPSSDISLGDTDIPVLTGSTNITVVLI